MSRRLQVWRHRWGDCKACPLGARAYKHVVGQGSRDARILAVGEAPGNSEDTIGEPFVGEAGQLMRTVWNRAGIKKEDVFLTNLVACRPHDAERYSQIRTPSSKEIAACQPRLIELVDMLHDLKVVVAIGSIAASSLPEFLNKLRFNLRHPAAFLHNGYTDRQLLDYQEEWSKVKQCLV